MRLRANANGKLVGYVSNMNMDATKSMFKRRRTSSGGCIFNSFIEIKLPLNLWLFGIALL